MGGNISAVANARDIFGYGVLLTRTMTSLGWNSWFSNPDQNQCDMDTYRSSWNCHAENPTALGTHWYIVGCIPIDDHFPTSDRFGYAETQGVYFNIDFPPSLGEAVFVNEFVITWVNGPDMGADQIHNFYGAWTSIGLGAGTFYQTSWNSCVM